MSVLVTKYTKIDTKQKSFLDSGMANYFNAKNPQKSNVTSVSSCTGRKRKDIGVVLPDKVSQKMSPFLREDFSKCCAA